MLPTLETNQKKEYQFISREAFIIASRINDILLSRININQALASFVERNPNVSHEEFDKFVKSLLRSDNNIIQSMTYIKKDFKESWVSPYTEKNQQSIKHFLETNPVSKKRLELIEQRVEKIDVNEHIGIDGPVFLPILGGYGFIIYGPVASIDKTTGKYNFIGAIDLLIEAENLYKHIRLNESTLIDIAIRTDTVGLTSMQSRYFYGDSTIFEKEDYISINVHFPNGKWQLAVYPKDG
jgi:sensor domain CHASE-containing protein